MINGILISILMSASTPASTIKIDNICISKFSDFTYEKNSVSDFEIVSGFKDGREHFIIYVGYSPQLEGANLKYSPGYYVSKSSKGDIITLVSPQEGDVLGVPHGMKDKYFHIHFNINGKDNYRIIKSVKFCSKSEA